MDSQLLLGPAGPDSVQSSSELPSNLERMSETLSPGPNCFPLLEPSHQAWPEISVENLWYPGPQLSCYQFLCADSLSSITWSPVLLGSGFRD